MRHNGLLCNCIGEQQESKSPLIYAACRVSVSAIAFPTIQDRVD